jgi:hypothetical protein
MRLCSCYLFSMDMRKHHETLLLLFVLHGQEENIMRTLLLLLFFHGHEENIMRLCRCCLLLHGHEEDIMRLLLLFVWFSMHKLKEEGKSHITHGQSTPMQLHKPRSLLRKQIPMQPKTKNSPKPTSHLRNENASIIQKIAPTTFELQTLEIPSGSKP